MSLYQKLADGNMELDGGPLDLLPPDPIVVSPVVTPVSGPVILELPPPEHGPHIWPGTSGGVGVVNGDGTGSVPTQYQADYAACKTAGYEWDYVNNVCKYPPMGKDDDVAQPITKLTGTGSGVSGSGSSGGTATTGSGITLPGLGRGLLNTVEKAAQGDVPSIWRSIGIAIIAGILIAGLRKVLR